MYTRAMKRATKYARAALFENMDMRTAQDALNFRYMPLPGHKPPSHQPQSPTHCCHSPLSAAHGALCLLRAAHVCTFLTHAAHAAHVLLPAARACTRLLRAAHVCKLNAACSPCNLLFTLPSPYLYMPASCSPCMYFTSSVLRVHAPAHPVQPTHCFPLLVQQASYPLT